MNNLTFLSTETSLIPANEEAMSYYFNQDYSFRRSYNSNSDSARLQLIQAAFSDVKTHNRDLTTSIQKLETEIFTLKMEKRQAAIRELYREPHREPINESNQARFERLEEDIRIIKESMQEMSKGKSKGNREKFKEKKKISKKSQKHP